MNASFHRHDLIWLDPEIDAGRFASDAQAEHARNWVKQDFPLVVARQSDELVGKPDQIVLGFTLPSAPMRTRVLLRADLAAIIRHSRPLMLRDAISLAPKHWQEALNKLAALVDGARATVRVYGSLSSQILTGMRYLDETSDLDLLLECGEDTKFRELLDALEKVPLPVPRIDGEILFPSGWAVAWRELATALGTGIAREVLAKSDREIRLIPAHKVAGSFLVEA